jgi:hypothetical protein
MTTSYEFKFNGWLLTMRVTLNNQKKNKKHEINVWWNIVGYESGQGVINMETKKLTLGKSISIKPYNSTGKVQELKEVVVGKYSFLSIKSYLE